MSGTNKARDYLSGLGLMEDNLLVLLEEPLRVAFSLPGPGNMYPRHYWLPYCELKENAPLDEANAMENKHRKVNVLKINFKFTLPWESYSYVEL